MEGNEAVAHDIIGMAEVARLLELHEDYVLRLTEEHVLPSRSIRGRDCSYDRSEMLAWRKRRWPPGDDSIGEVVAGLGQ